MNQFNELIDTPISLTTLEYVYNEILLKNLGGSEINIMGFWGCWKTAELKYLTNNLHDEKFAKHVYSFINLDNQEESLNEILLYIVNNFPNNLTTESTNAINKLDSSEDNFNKITQILHELTFAQDLKVTIFIDNMHKIKDTKLLAKLVKIKLINPMNISFGYLTSNEFDENLTNMLGELKGSFLQKIIWPKNSFFNKNDSDYLIKNIEKRSGCIFNDKFKAVVLNMCENDPSLMKTAVMKAINNKSYEETISQTKSVEEFYETVGAKVIDTRYTGVCKTLLKDSVRYLLGELKDPTEFLLGTGLVVESEQGGYDPMNKVFEHFIKTRKDFLKQLIMPAETISSLSDDSITNDLMTVRKALSGTEMLVFNVLVEKLGSMVEKDVVAKAIWNEGWEDKFSDWALTQTIYRLRKKLNNYGFSIKTVAGQGFILNKNL